MEVHELTSLGLRLRHARRKRKMSQSALAGAAGITQPSVSELESGETKEISGPVLIAISSALKIRPAWLVNGRGPMDADELETLSADERELLHNYREALPRWKVSVRYMAQLRGDAEQDEAAESMNVVLAKISATPVPDERLGSAWTRPDKAPVEVSLQQRKPSPHKKPRK
jgi:transcriptional regulator with XRE-family HTH domain